MSNLTQLKKNPAKTLAIELLAFNPELSLQQIADKVGVSKSAIVKWKATPEFIDAVYDRYMMHFGLEVPQVLDSMVREAKAGNVQAGRLVLEHSGKLVKNINVTIDSPFEKFLKNVPDAEIVDDAEIIDAADVVEVFEELPERKIENQNERTKKEKVATKDLIKKAERNAKQKNWYKWRVRAKAVGIEPLKGRRPTPAQRKNWEKSIIEAERLRESE
ncbi:MAG: hypothetical protein GOVbin1434_7 [Prokaryotic dsDNA virus sp.]|nr:MAG: hypothetical protein GOVbin1434_7 [Prokaryotic dsDNA virus sp.]|tara:strand:- start:3308 stop:3958 length:651 start_codon:yes stop_codon:yes gene_type:complete